MMCFDSCLGVAGGIEKREAFILLLHLTDADHGHDLFGELGILILHDSNSRRSQ